MNEVDTGLYPTPIDDSITHELIDKICQCNALEDFFCSQAVRYVSAAFRGLPVEDDTESMTYRYKIQLAEFYVLSDKTYSDPKDITYIADCNSTR